MERREFEIRSCRLRRFQIREKIAVFLSNIYSRKFILAELKCEVSFKIECCSAGVRGFV